MNRNLFGFAISVIYVARKHQDRKLSQSRARKEIPDKLLTLKVGSIDEWRNSFKRWFELIPFVK